MNEIIYVAGMHRSGTSMVARLLTLCGVYLGPENVLSAPQADNIEGHWENSAFTALNDRLLAQLDAGWDYPPQLEAGWEDMARLQPLRAEALELLAQFSDRQLWGWKDPRNSLTFPFWNDLLPSLKVVICVRNPLDVAQSLLQRNYFSRALSYQLWLEYNQQILAATQTHQRIITHYETFFTNPHAELTRILSFLSIKVPESSMERAIQAVKFQLHHNRSTLSDLIDRGPLEVLALYQKMCDPAFDGMRLTRASHEIQNSHTQDLETKYSAETHIRELSRELVTMKNLIQEKEAHDVKIRTQLYEREQQLSEIYQSKAWHFVHAVRQLRKKILG